MSAAWRSSSGTAMPVASSNSRRRVRPSNTWEPSASERRGGRAIGAGDRRLLVDAADQPLDQVVQRDDAGGAAVLVHHDRELLARRTHLVEQLVRALADGHGRHRPERARTSNVSAAAGSEAAGTGRAGRGTPSDVVQRLLVDGQPAVAARARAGQQLGQGDVHGHRLDLRARRHQLARGQVGELEGAAGDARLRGLHLPRLLAGPQQEAQLLRAVHHLLAAGRVHPEHAQHRVADRVEHADGPAEHAVEPVQRPRHPERGALGALEGEALGRQLAEHDVEGGDHGERDADRDAVRGGPREAARQRLQHRLEQAGERGLADPAQPQRGHGDAELAGRDVAVEVVDHVAGHHRRCARPSAASCSRRERRTATMANSAATKKPLASTSTITAVRPSRDGMLLELYRAALTREAARGLRCAPPAEEPPTHARGRSRPVQDGPEAAAALPGVDRGGRLGPSHELHVVRRHRLRRSSSTRCASTRATPAGKDADVFVLSKGHAAPILWAVLKEAGAIERRPEHPAAVRQPARGPPHAARALGARGHRLARAGALRGGGHGLGAQAGQVRRPRLRAARATARWRRARCGRPAQFASFYKLDNLCAIVDVNRLGQSGPTMYQHDLSRYEARLRAFGWEVAAVDGHDVAAVRARLRPRARRRGPARSRSWPARSRARASPSWRTRRAGTASR